MSDWSAEQYSKFEKERTLPSCDLANAINVQNAKKIIDIGCGIGNSTAVLREKYPAAEIIGADNSEAMLKAARETHPDIEFIALDAGRELDSMPSDFDIVFSNACIQWIPEHKRLLGRMMGLLKDGGIMAVQIPQQRKHPMHKVIEGVSASDKWKAKITEPRWFNILTEEEYYSTLSELSGDFRIWEITYFHSMPSHRSIVEWYKGTGMRPYLAQLSDGDKADFENDVLSETERTYPLQSDGNIIFRFPRLFFTARKC